MHKLIAVVDHLAFDCVTGTAAVESADTGVVFFHDAVPNMSVALIVTLACCIVLPYFSMYCYA